MWNKSDYYIYDDPIQLPNKATNNSIVFKMIRMIPVNMFVEDLLGAVIRYGLYIGAVFQLLCLLACVMLAEHSEPVSDEIFTDSDDSSSDESSPGHRATMSRVRRHDKKKRR